MNKLSFFMGITTLSILMSSITFFLYITKKKTESWENRIYVGLLVSNYIGLFLELGCHLFARQAESNLFFLIILKLYVVYLMTYTLLFNIYVFMVSHKEKKENSHDEYKHFKTLFLFTGVALIVFTLITFMTKLNVFYDNTSQYTYGIAIDKILIPISGMLFLLWIIRCGINFKDLKNKKYLPIFAFVLMGIIASALQIHDRSMLIITAVHTMTTLIMANTVENPDIKMLEELNILKVKAESSNNVKNAFLKQMRHEINTPAMLVQYHNEENRDIAIKIKNNDILDNTKIVDVNIKDIKALVGNAVLVADLENKDFTLEEYPYKTADIIDRINYVVKNSYSLGKEKIKFKLNVSDKLPTTLIGDYQNIENIMLNLLSNAFKYTEKGQINLIINVELKNDICYLEIIVKDTGIGIRKSDMKSLFNKFERIDFDNNQNDKRGVGLGLSIVKKVAELMGGEVSAQSEFGVGSTFTVNILQKMAKGTEK